jgi:hypothetical protein
VVRRHPVLNQCLVLVDHHLANVVGSIRSRSGDIGGACAGRRPPNDGTARHLSATHFSATHLAPAHLAAGDVSAGHFATSNVTAHNNSGGRRLRLLMQRPSWTPHDD